MPEKAVAGLRKYVRIDRLMLTAVQGALGPDALGRRGVCRVASSADLALHHSLLTDLRLPLARIPDL